MLINSIKKLNVLTKASSYNIYFGNNIFDNTKIILKKYIQNRNRDIKNVLMDQKFISGIGNIYANEILFLSRLKPSRKAKLIKLYEVKRIIKFTKSILSRSIKQGGSSIKDFSSSNKKKGSFQQYFNVYGKKGYKCSNTDCIGKVKKIVITNRASFFCPMCQK